MAGTIVVDRIESDASYASTINVAGQITFSNTVNFGVYGGTAPVAGFYLPATNTLAFTTASSERMRIDSSGNVGIGTSSPSYPLTVVSNSSAVGLATYGRSSDNLAGTYYFSNNGATTYGTILGSATEFRLTSTPAAAVQTFFTNGSERMRIDSSGRVTMPYQPYVHATVGSGTTAINFGTTHANVTVPYNSIFTNTGNHFNTSNYTFTCPVAGIYAVYATIQIGQAAGTTGVGPNMQVSRSGAAITGSYHFVQSSVGYQKMETTAFVKCAVNDTLYITLYTGSAMTNGSTEFNGDSRNALCIAFMG